MGKKWKLAFIANSLQISWQNLSKIVSFVVLYQQYIFVQTAKIDWLPWQPKDKL